DCRLEPGERSYGGLPGPVGQPEPFGDQLGLVDAAPDLDGARMVDCDPRNLPARGVCALPPPHDRLNVERAPVSRHVAHACSGGCASPGCGVELVIHLRNSGKTPGAHRRGSSVNQAIDSFQRVAARKAAAAAGMSTRAAMTRT